MGLRVQPGRCGLADRARSGCGAPRRPTTAAGSNRLRSPRPSSQPSALALAAAPGDAGARIDLAYALEDAGLGEEAREQAPPGHRSRAPGQAFIWSAYGWVLQHNEVGIDHGKGAPYNEAVAAYRKALTLDPNSSDIRLSLAEILRYNADGVEYAPDAHLAESIDLLRAVERRQHPVSLQLRADLGIELLYLRRFAEAQAECAQTPQTPTMAAVELAAIAASAGPAAAAARLGRYSEDADRTNTLELAADALTRLRLYAASAALLEAGTSAGDRNPWTLRQIQLGHMVKPYNPPPAASDNQTDPTRPVIELLTGALAGSLSSQQVENLLSRHAYASEAEWHQAAHESSVFTALGDQLRRETQTSSLVITDMLMSLGHVTLDPAADAGNAVTFNLNGRLIHFFVVKEDGTYRIAAAEGDFTQVGEEALYLLHAGRPAEARALLDWKRAAVQAPSPDDPLGGVLFASLWAPRGRPQTNDPQLAAASLAVLTPTVLSPTVDALLPAIATRRDATAPGPGPHPAKDTLTLLLAYASLRQKDKARSTAETQTLLALYPDSPTALQLRGQAFALNGEYAAWQALLQAKLKANPDNAALQRQQALAAEAANQYPAARAIYAGLIESSKASAADTREYAWLALFAKPIRATPADALAQRALEQQSLGSRPDNLENADNSDNQKDWNASFVANLALACLKAQQGNAAEARPAALRAYETAYSARAQSALWVAFGLIDEAYGENDAARNAYARVTRPAGEQPSADAYALAQQRLALLAPAALVPTALVPAAGTHDASPRSHQPHQGLRRQVRRRQRLARHSARRNSRPRR